MSQKTEDQTPRKVRLIESQDPFTGGVRSGKPRSRDAGESFIVPHTIELNSINPRIRPVAKFVFPYLSSLFNPSFRCREGVGRDTGRPRCGRVHSRTIEGRLLPGGRSHEPGNQGATDIVSVVHPGYRWTDHARSPGGRKSTPGASGRTTLVLLVEDVSVVHPTQEVLVHHTPFLVPNTPFTLVRYRGRLLPSPAGRT